MCGKMLTKTLKLYRGGELNNSDKAEDLLHRNQQIGSLSMGASIRIHLLQIVKPGQNIR